jgi:hypothetical protein
MTVAHLRTYTINAGQMDSWLTLFNEQLIPLLREHDIRVDGAWVNDARTQFIWVRSYGETDADLERKEAAFYGSDWWQANVGFVRSHLAHREITVIRSL